MLATIINAFVILFMVVDPITVVPVFAMLTRGEDTAERRRVAIKGTIIAAIILLLFAFFGDRLIKALGITLPAFRIAGGALLFLVAVDMVFARQSGVRNPTPSEQIEAEHREDISVFPLAFPLIAGPGAITTTLLLATSSRGHWDLFLGVLLVVILVMIMTLVSLLLTPPIMRILGQTGANVVGRIFGLILAALSVQFVIDGILEVF